MKILELENKNFEEVIKIAAATIKNGQVLICPTDTVYGLICDATNKKAVEKIFAIKKRDENKPLPIFIRDIKMAKELAEIDKEQEEFLKKSWPGKVTVVLKSEIRNPKSEINSKFKIYGIDKETIALRIPDNQVISYLLSVIGLPLVETSANLSGQPASTKIKEILSQFDGQGIQPDLVIDAGDSAVSKPSQVVDLTSENPRIIRY